jgi:hypothetical protein
LEGAAVQKAEDVVGDRLGLFEMQEVPCAEDSPTFVMYRSSPAMKRPSPGDAEEFASMGCSPSRQACTQPVR